MLTGETICVGISLFGKIIYHVIQVRFSSMSSMKSPQKDSRLLSGPKFFLHYQNRSRYMTSDSKRICPEENCMYWIVVQDGSDQNVYACPG